MSMLQILLLKNAEKDSGKLLSGLIVILTYERRLCATYVGTVQYVGTF